MIHHRYHVNDDADDNENILNQAVGDLLLRKLYIKNEFNISFIGQLLTGIGLFRICCRSIHNI